MATIHQQRIAEQIRTVLSELFLREMRDPRLQGLTVTDVTVDREIQYAEIYVHALGEDERQDEVLEALERATGYLRREVAGFLRTRSVPQLRFHWDPTLEHAERINELLDRLDIPAETADTIDAMDEDTPEE